MNFADPQGVSHGPIVGVKGPGVVGRIDRFDRLIRIIHAEITTIGLRAQNVPLGVLSEHVLRGV